MQITLDSVSLATKGTPRLVDVSLEVPDGSFVSVLGASGAGKSTLLGVVSGLIPHDSGRVLFDGQSVDDLPAHRRDVAVVFQDARLFPNMNALDNVAFPLKVRGVGRKERRERAAKMLAQVQLEDMGHGGSTSFRAASASGWPWPGRWWPTPAPYCSTNRSAVSTNPCATTCAAWSKTCTDAWAPPCSW